ncbi:hypothetical protein [Streptomyces sp. NPDC058572]|uniref:hypothetical protein n=1 Tax=Streptomyces sp. NPDC058572 TaxID=3346546 RepID=UPI00364A3E0B
MPDYCAHLARQRHPVETITAYVTTLSNLLAVNGHPLAEQDRYLIRAVLASRSLEVATDPGDPGDALQSTACTRADLRAMLGTLDRSTVRGKRDALALVLDWHMAGRSCEPGAIGVHDVRETVAAVPDLEDGPGVELPALVVTVRRSKTNPHGKRTDTVRLVAQTDADADLCPVRAYRAWRAVLVEHGCPTRARCCGGSTGGAGSAAPAGARAGSRTTAARRPGSVIAPFRT